MAEPDQLMAQNRSTLKEFLASIATISGDLSNITAPPFLLDTKSTVELPQYWADHPSIFCAPARSSDPAERAMLVLRWYLSSLRNQNYMGRGEHEGVKKPLNAFLGELFLGKFEGGEDIGETRLVGEQVSHHPPITACRVWNETHGVIAEGYTRQTISFSGNVTIQQTGHALFTLTKRDNESYLIPLPTLKVRGILSGTPYPELSGKYYITSTSGYTSVIDFSGRSWFSGKKNSLCAKVYHQDDGEDNPVYTVNGQWNGEFVIHDVRKEEDVEIFDVNSQVNTASKLIVDPLDEQDPWETRRAWQDVISSLHQGDMAGTSKAKSKIEQGQRNMRKDDEMDGQKWQPVFFRCVQNHEIAEKLEQLVPGNGSLNKEKKETLGIWVFEDEKWKSGRIQKPYHENLVPDNSQSTREYSIDNRRDSGVYPGTRFPEDGGDARRRSSVSSIYSHTSSQRSGMLQSPSSLPRPRNSIESGRSSPRSPRASVDNGHRASSGSLFSFSSLRNSLSSLTTGATIAKDQPEPQVEQVFRSTEAKHGSGIEGMTLHEKSNIEDFLRDQYSSRGAAAAAAPPAATTTTTIDHQEQGARQQSNLRQEVRV